MKDDTREELERIEQELLAQEEMPPLCADEPADNTESLHSIIHEFSGPAFDDPEEIHEPEEPMVYCNFSNDYGKDLPQENASEEAAKKGPDKVVLGLMIAVCGLCLGIIGVLTYWLNAFL
jgi:hypothetical protein